MERLTVRTVVSALPGLLMAALCLLAGSSFGQSAPAPSDTLILVNGDPITTSDFEQLIQEAHRDFRSGGGAEVTAGRLLDKRVNDYLIIQDALAADYDDDESLQTMIKEKTREYAIGLYVRDQVDLPKSAPDDSVRAFFERYYWRIQMRRISVRTVEEAEALRTRVVAGADLDSLAQALSLDTKKLQGGLYNLLYWADVENRIRDEVRGLEVGAYTRVFPYNDAYTFLRVERLLPVHEEAYAKFKPTITPVVHGQLRQRVWDDFLKEQTARAKLHEDVGALMAVIGDSAKVLTGEFLVTDPAYVFEIEGGEGVSGTELRRAVSHEAMQNALAPFGHHLTAARSDLTNELVLGSLAEAAGYFENAEVTTMVDKDWEKDLIARYLDDHVTSKITFKRSEFDDLYEANKETMRGPDEVRLDVLILEEREQAEEASQRLKEGADFGYIFGQYNPGQEIALGNANFIKESELSQAFRDGLAGLEVGGSSAPIEMPMGYMIFRLDARRPGAVPPFEAVEMDIRRVLFKRNFDRLLAEHMAVLKERSEITWWNDRIDAYLASGKEGQ